MSDTVHCLFEVYLTNVMFLWLSVVCLLSVIILIFYVVPAFLTLMVVVQIVILTCVLVHCIV